MDLQRIYPSRNCRHKSLVPAFFHSFLLLPTFVKSIGPKRHLYFYQFVLELFLCYSISIQQYLMRQHLTQLLLLVTVVKGIGPKLNLYFCSFVLELFLCYSTSYPIVPHTAAFLQSFLLLVTVIKGIGPKLDLYFCWFVLELFLCYSTSYPIVPHGPSRTSIFSNHQLQLENINCLHMIRYCYGDSCYLSEQVAKFSIHNKIKV